MIRPAIEAQNSGEEDAEGVLHNILGRALRGV